ncbi:hypothetical protein DSO57_1002173 [Entomophthora muscae]|uniref:Uncharacterized protein n=1 Tax=Entomophthora muscae TaxID=34485 RepID=A0ACC2T8R0_9FUNG|nr:hypothetical protein DSO57_1002173 [Entomophthora muscae]
MGPQALGSGLASGIRSGPVSGEGSDPSVLDFNPDKPRQATGRAGGLPVRPVRVQSQLTSLATERLGLSLMAEPLMVCCVIRSLCS